MTELLKTLPVVKNKIRLDPEKSYAEYGLAAKPSTLNALTWRIHTLPLEEQAKYADKFCIDACSSNDKTYFSKLNLATDLPNARYYTSTAIANLAYCALNLKDGQQQETCKQHHKKIIQLRKQCVAQHEKKQIALVISISVVVFLFSIVMWRIMSIVSAL